MGIIRTNRIKEKLKQKQPVFDARITILDPELVEIAGTAGVDVIWIDGEHSNFDWQRAQACILAAELHGITPVLRPTELPGYREYMIQRALNIGFQGMVVTGVRSPADMKALLDVMKFPPEGKRGVGEGRVFERAGEQVHRGPEILQALNAEIFTAVLIESVAGVDTIDAICALEGVDAVGLGHRDYALDAKLPNFSIEQEGMQSAKRTINAAAKKQGKAWFGDPSTAESFKQSLAEGALLFSVARETKVWQKACMNVTQYRAMAGA